MTAEGKRSKRWKNVNEVLCVCVMLGFNIIKAMVSGEIYRVEKK